jgi:hypothetical protein
MSGLDAAVNAVSEPEKKAEKISRMKMTLKETNMAVSLRLLGFQ